jgi:putative transcriptional regulator
MLIAMPQLVDPHFNQTVVLMIEHGPRGSLGLVLNRPVDITCGEVGESQSCVVADEKISERVHWGGPVESQRGFVLHTSAAIDERTEILPGVFLSISAPSLHALLSDGASKMRLCLGYAGWGSGQLDEEIRQSGWLYTEPLSATIFHENSDVVWDETLRGMGLEPGFINTTGGIN